MSKTVDGGGTNQQRTRGASVSPNGQAAIQDPRLKLTDLVPSPPAEVHALQDLPLPEQSKLKGLDQFRAKATDRAVFRLMDRRTNLIFNDMKLEGVNYTEPEIAEILEGRPPQTTTDDSEINQIIDLSEATDHMIELCRAAEFRLDRPTSNTLNGIAMRTWIMEPGVIRGAGLVGGGGDVNAMGIPFKAPQPATTNLEQLFDYGVSKLQEHYDHPAAQAVGWAAFAAYNQFYGDGNKRTSRLMMNGHLMSHGYDALVTPVAREVEYNESLRDMYRDGDPAPFMNFMLGLYDDDA